MKYSLQSNLRYSVDRIFEELQLEIDSQIRNNFVFVIDLNLIGTIVKVGLFTSKMHEGKLGEAKTVFLHGLVIMKFYLFEDFGIGEDIYLSNFKDPDIGIGF